MKTPLPGQKTALVLGAAGFIGGHMCRRLKEEGYWVRGADIALLPSDIDIDEFWHIDLRDEWAVSRVMWAREQKSVDGTGAFDEVYQFAADMGGAGYIFTGENDFKVMHNSALINLHVAKLAVSFNVKKLFYSSSACIYPGDIQTLYESPSLREEDAYPANPDSEYGWEKIFSERVYLSAARNFGLNVRIARFHNIYGPHGTWKGGKEKAPAAMIRKALSPMSEDVFVENMDRWITEYYIEVWGTGHQTRSFLYIDDCIEAVRRLMDSDHREPINIGSEESISINDLAEIALSLAGDNSTRIRNIDGPIGVNGRNSDNAIVREVLDWEPRFSLVEGMGLTYNWIKSQYDADELKKSGGDLSNPS